jgi:hypothetical protein
MNEDDKDTKEPVKKTSTAKKAAPKKTTAKPKVEKTEVKSENTEEIQNYKIIVFESGTAYVSGEIRFTRDNNIQKLPNEDADRLLELDNFRLADQLEIEDFLSSRED